MIQLPIPAGLAASLRAQAQAVVPALASWLAQRHRSDGQALAQTVITEHSVSRTIEPFDITIKGRIDRIELTDHGAHLIDFKTTDPLELGRRIKAVGDDIQLPVYAWLMENDASTLKGQPVVSAAYVSIRRDQTKDVPVAAGSADLLRDHTQATIEFLTQKLISIQRGDPITAEGLAKNKKICDQCSVRGICRRDDLLIAADQEDLADEL